MSQAAAQSGRKLLAVHEMKVAVAVTKFSKVRYTVTLHSKYTRVLLDFLEFVSASRVLRA